MEFWLQLCPGFSIGSRPAAPASRLPDLGPLLAVLREEGYVQAPDVFVPADVARLQDGIRRLVGQGILPAFAFVYDEYWHIFQSLSAFLSAALGPGFQMLPDLWAWYVPPSNEAAGWQPHRDRSGAAIRPDNSPDSLTVWLPLTDATPLNGCMYVLPARHDPNLHAVTLPENGVFQLAGESLQNIRALPATAGSLLAWNQALLHWGGRASHLGAHPRCSIAAQFQRGDLPAFERPLLNPQAPPSFAERIGLIGHLICGFSGFLALPAELRVLAAALDWKHWRASAAR